MLLVRLIVVLTTSALALHVFPRALNAAEDNFGPGRRVLLHAHNCYPEGALFADRLDRALGTGTPILIEQDLVWYRDPVTGASRSIVSHGAPFTGTEPGLREHFFETIKPIVEGALRDGDARQWPLVTLHLDFKTNETEHHAAVWSLLGEYPAWITTAERAADASVVKPLDVKPVLVLTENGDGQERDFHDRVPVGERLRFFGTLPAAVPPANLSAREQAAWLATVDPAELMPHRRTNYRRWTNFSWFAVERGGAISAGPWTADEAQRLRALVNRAHALDLWIRFYTLNGHPADDEHGWSPGYNVGSLEAVQERWRAAITAGVDFIATDQYEAFAGELGRIR